MMQRYRRLIPPAITVAVLLTALVLTAFADVSARSLHREAATKTTLDYLPSWGNTNRIVVKLAESVGQVDPAGKSLVGVDQRLQRVNEVLNRHDKYVGLERRMDIEATKLRQIRDEAAKRAGDVQLPDLTLYFDVDIAADATADEKLRLINEIKALDVVEVAYFEPVPSLPMAPTPNWQSSQNYLEPAPIGVDAYYAWTAPGGKGETVKVIDIEGNWVESHEDLRGGTSSFHIAGSKINDPTWWNHGTAVLGEIAADSNSFGNTGIAFNVDLGTVSIGSMDLSTALITAANNSDTGDIILIELQYEGPNGGAYVPAEYFQDHFDAIVTATAMGRIVVEAGANGSQDLDDTTLYGQLFNPDFRFSGAIMVGAANNVHIPEWFTSYGERIDVHGFGSGVYTLGYGDLYGSDTTTYYTAQFGGTSSASPIIVGACAALQGINKAIHGRVLDHSELRDLLQTYSTPQAPNFKQIGPMPDLAGSVEELQGVSFSADTTFGWAPFDVQFTASSGLTVDTWTWDFGDGDSSGVQSPGHQYSQAGIYDVSVEIDAGGDVRVAQKEDYIVAVADTLDVNDIPSTEAGETIEVVVYGNNTIKLNDIRIPLVQSGDFTAQPDSFSIEGCRTWYWDDIEYLHYDAFFGRYTFQLQPGDAAPLPIGDGPLLKVYFTIPETVQPGDTMFVSIEPYLSYDLQYTGSLGTYTPVGDAMSVAIECVLHGDADGVPPVNIQDLTYLVGFLFESGPDPIPYLAGDVNCDDVVNIADLTYLVAFLFSSGPSPCEC
jgi:PKD repeat protein